MSRLTVIGTVVCEDIETPRGKSSPPPGLGGSSIYASVAAQLLYRVDLIGMVGADFPEPYLRRLQSLNIDLNGLQWSSGKTFYWKAKYAQDLLTRDTLALDLGVYEHYHPQLPANCRRSEYVLIANLMPQLQDEVLAQLDSPGIVMLGTIDHWVCTERPCIVSLLPRVDGFIANEEEMRLFAGLSDSIAAAKYVATLGSKFTVVTLAERGAVLVMGEKEFHFPAFPCETVQDPTGAGDSFAGGLLASLARDRATDISEQSLCRAMLYGTALASLCVETFSVEGLCRAQLEDVEKRVAILRRMVDFPT
jgi:sugar/nucleoside kinase (ribokinase family)